MLAVTTFSKTGYEKYAKKTLESMRENLPVETIVYSEFPLEGARNFFEIDGVVPFYNNIQNVPICRGITDKGYNYNYDVWKFSRKMFAQWDVLKDYKGKVLWIDADCYVRKPVPESFLESLFDKKGLSYLGREGLYTETGFVGFDTENEKFGEFLSNYMGFIKHAWFLNHKRWHDCEAFDFAREESGISGNNLSPFFKIPKDRSMSMDDLDVFDRSNIGEYIFHAKGGRKDLFKKVPTGFSYNTHVVDKSSLGEYISHKKGPRKDK